MKGCHPKLHACVHEERGHEQYSLYYTVGIGTTDGESAERIWVPHNALGNSTKTQGPRSCHDVLDDHWGFWNWLKYHQMDVYFHLLSVPQRNLQTEAHRGFTATLLAEDVEHWTTAIEKWERDKYHSKKSPCPYKIKTSGQSVAQVRKDQAAEEQKQLSEGSVVYHEVSASSFISIGIDLVEL
ncbi:hypothetical protein HYDPIDRAFT_91762 [Hydnomerulius pinastri MD-312]|uniref:Uncharacterized protein n=1 Tax=Hydnomerulius pinastri MD-312 TaxID=994086 RepID=A0A0C9WEW7_9AGAM|nr:hypothetical protein HYDPIDRAFT_91762 [Hydnomerulius pinastri MD-312]